MLKPTKPRKITQLCQHTEQVENNCHIPDLVQAFCEQNGGLNRVLQHAKPPSVLYDSHPQSVI